MDNILLEQGYDFLKGDKAPTDPLEKSGGEIINNLGHGTSTASLMISSPQAQGSYDNGKYVTGVAPGAKLVPLRVSYSVVLLNTSKLAQGIKHAADNGCHLISISLGTAFPNSRLREPITYAQKQGLIIVAASGTIVPYIVYPAASDEVIAVCGSNIRREIWWAASRGKKVDVTAPGQTL
ncbi:peptidase S8 and S53, subtilisin, kexin, sedolisin [Richelia intracellularis]|nr:peptidase S8 and S53, subtilisin, kexin, sedolisin [Richelia intracellularis]